MAANTAVLSPYRAEMVRRAYVQVIGVIWMPATTAATSYQLNGYDLENIGEFTRENVEQWLCTHAGDFQSVTDFRAVCGAVEVEWADPESECTFNDCMYPED